MNLDFKLFLIFLLASFLLSFVMSMASIFLSSKTPDKEKVSMYECGFNPINTPGKPFSMSFFLMGVLFLVFDLEMTYLFPWAMSTNMINLKGQLVMIVFMAVLVMGLIYEWFKGGLEWE